MSSIYHPDRFIPVSDGWYARYQSIMRLPRGKQGDVLRRERAILRNDALGLVQRESLWATIHDTHRAFNAFKGPVIEVPSYPTRYRDEEQFADLGLPKVFFLNFGSDFGLEVGGDRDRFVEGVYFVECMINGKNGFRYVVVTDTPHDLDAEKVPLGESLLEQTRAAVGFIELGQTLDESIDQVSGDPMVCRSVQSEDVRDALKNGTELAARLSFDKGNSMSAAGGDDSGMRLSF